MVNRALTPKPLAHPLLARVPRERFFQLSWRPRHPSLLGKEELDKIQKNLKQYSQRYEEEDKQLNIATDRELLEERRKLLREWRAWLESRAEWAEEQRQAAQELLGDKFEVRAPPCRGISGFAFWS